MGGNKLDEDAAYSFNLKPWNNKPHTTAVAAATTSNSGSSRRASPLPSNASRLTSLPMELQLEILSYVDLRGLIQLRRTSRLYRSVITRDYLVRRFAADSNGNGNGPLKYCCSQCLTMPPVEFLLLALNHSGEGSGSGSNNAMSLSSETLCHRCWRPRLGPPSDERRGGGDPHSIDGQWPLAICPFCGWPMAGSRSHHPGCYTRRFCLLVVWFVLGLAQFAVGVFGAVASWSVYEDDPRIKIPSSVSTSFLLFPWGIYNSNAQWECDPYFLVCDSFPKTSLVVYIVNFIFRFLNTVGYAMLAYDYDFRNLFLPDLPVGKKSLYAFAACLVWWAVVA
ncbi:hypothetical protein PG985_010877 [Apiospora marii]|uniref:F-box domain-containing protein n=1 Tax=Apiospora marii TaxID=335849 RepID=A0ABR1T272_9PEZI